MTFTPLTVGLLHNAYRKLKCPINQCKLVFQVIPSRTLTVERKTHITHLLDIWLRYPVHTLVKSAYAFYTRTPKNEHEKKVG